MIGGGGGVGRHANEVEGRGEVSHYGTGKGGERFDVEEEELVREAVVVGFLRHDGGLGLRAANKGEVEMVEGCHGLRRLVKVLPCWPASIDCESSHWKRVHDLVRSAHMHVNN